MRKQFSVALAMLSALAMAEPISVDLSKSTVAVEGKSDIRVRNLKIAGVEQTFSVLLKWDGDKMTYIPTNAAPEEPKPTTQPDPTTGEPPKLPEQPICPQPPSNLPNPACGH
ncbi:hypothetical protein [Chitinimonas sp.]|uniref:hypothetical protein n=1 Tax=Chitinimonas sp. TaxID=1934313 RepID=UPI0035AEB559